MVERVQACHNSIVTLQQKLIDHYGKRMDELEQQFYQLLSKVVQPMIDRQIAYEEQFDKIRFKCVNIYIKRLTPMYTQVLLLEEKYGRLLEIVPQDNGQSGQEPTGSDSVQDTASDEAEDENSGQRNNVVRSLLPPPNSGGGIVPPVGRPNVPNPPLVQTPSKPPSCCPSSLQYSMSEEYRQAHLARVNTMFGVPPDSDTKDNPMDKTRQAIVNVYAKYDLASYLTESEAITMYGAEDTTVAEEET